VRKKKREHKGEYNGKKRERQYCDKYRAATSEREKENPSPFIMDLGDMLPSSQYL